MDYTKLPVIYIGNYLWDLANGDVQGSTKLPSSVWDVDEYNTVQPFFAVNQSISPNIFPYILYDFLYTGSDINCFPLIKEEATLSIIGPWDKLYPLKNFIYDSLSQFDISASRINSHIRTNNGGIHFKYIKVRQEQYALDEKKAVGLTDGLYVSTLYVTYEYSRS